MLAGQGEERGGVEGGIGGRTAEEERSHKGFLIFSEYFFHFSFTQ